MLGEGPQCPGTSEASEGAPFKLVCAAEQLTSSPLHAPDAFTSPTSGRPSFAAITLSRMRLSRYRSVETRGPMSSTP